MFTVRVEIDEQEPFTVKVGSRDVSRWEQAGRGKAGQRHLGLLEQAPRMSDIYELTFYALDRQGLWIGDLPKLRECADLSRFKADEDLEETDGLDPTRPDL